MPEESSAYREAGVDIGAVENGLDRIIAAVKGTWPAAGVGRVALDIGYFANVLEIGGGVGLAICTDGVGSKSLIAEMMRRWDTIGIDCVAMNVNDLICVGATPLSMVDYIAVAAADPQMLGALAVGLAEGARQAGVSISGGEIATLKGIVTGFDLVGMAVGLVPLDRVIVGRDLAAGDIVIGIHSDGIHSNGMTLARHALLERARLSLADAPSELESTLGDELLRPTPIYVREILEIIRAVSTVKALVNITGDGLLNLPRVAAPVGFIIDDLPPPPPIFGLIQKHGDVATAEMFEVYNMGVGFCVLAAAADADKILGILASHDRRARIIGHVVADPAKRVRVPQHRLVGRGKKFRAE